MWVCKEQPAKARSIRLERLGEAGDEQWWEMGGLVGVRAPVMGNEGIGGNSEKV